MKKKDAYIGAITLLEELKYTHPSISLGKHLETIREQCGDFWGISDTTLHSCVKDYVSTIAFHSPISLEEDVAYIMEDAEHLFDEEEN